MKIFIPATVAFALLAAAPSRAADNDPYGSTHLTPPGTDSDSDKDRKNPEAAGANRASSAPEKSRDGSRGEVPESQVNPGAADTPPASNSSR